MFSKGSNKSASSDDFSIEPAPAPALAPAPAPAPARPAPRNAAPSIISADLTITGDLVSNGDLQIDGVVEGDVKTRTVTVGEGAHVRGSISAETVRVCGAVSGQIKGGTVTLAKTAKVLGDIVHQTLAIEPGAFFEGHCRRSDSGHADADSKISMMKDKGGSTGLGSSLGTGGQGPIVQAVS